MSQDRVRGSLGNDGGGRVLIVMGLVLLVAGVAVDERVRLI